MRCTGSDRHLYRRGVVEARPEMECQDKSPRTSSSRAAKSQSHSFSHTTNIRQIVVFAFSFSLADVRMLDIVSGSEEDSKMHCADCSSTN